MKKDDPEIIKEFESQWPYWSRLEKIEKKQKEDGKCVLPTFSENAMVGDKIAVDYSKDNPALHALYVVTAVRHLALVRELIQKLDDAANINLSDMACGINEERAKLIITNRAYWEAYLILRSIEEIEREFHPERFE